MGAEWELK
jgi:hypothetical protein